MNLTPLQHDALLESFNIAIARAAVSLSRLMREEIALSIPELELLNIDEAISRLHSLSDNQISVVMQHFEGDIDSRAMLIFPQSRTLEIVRLAVGGLVDSEELPDLEQEAISEVGNILLNACMSALANQLKLELHTAPPAYLCDTPEHILSGPHASAYNVVLMIHISLNIKRHQIMAHIAFMLDARSNQTLADAINRVIESWMEHAA